MTTAPKQSVYDNSALLAEDEGYHKGLKPRQLQMIAIGGAIGTGLFLGAGGRLHNAGPGLFLSYAFCGIFVFLILRALGELVLHRPSSGSFVSYAREFLGEMGHILTAIFSALRKRESRYATLLAAVLELAGEKAEAVPVKEDESLDETWQEPVAFDGCSTAGQARPGQPQPIQIVRRAAPPSQGART